LFARAEPAAVWLCDTGNDSRLAQLRTSDFGERLSRVSKRGLTFEDRELE
jgi:hypothetical protein